MANSKAPTESVFEMRTVIEKLGVSQRGLSRLLGKSLDWVGRIVRGQFSPSWPNAALIARALDVSVGVFLEGDPARKDFFELGIQQVIDKASKPTTGKTAAASPRRKRRSGKTDPSVN